MSDLVEEIKEEIQNSILAHTKWKVKLREAIETSSSEFTVENSAAYTECEFGKWLLSARGKLIHYKEYQEIDQLHKEVHKETAKIMKLALEGKKEEATKALDFGTPFSSSSAKLVNLMKQWRDSL